MFRVGGLPEPQKSCRLNNGLFKSVEGFRAIALNAFGVQKKLNGSIF